MNKKYDKKIQKYHDKAKKALFNSTLNMFSYYELKAVFYEMLKESDSNE